VIFFQGFLPLAFTDPSVSRKAAVLVLVCPEYFISPVPSISGERSPIRHLGRHPNGRPVTPHGSILLLLVKKTLIQYSMSLDNVECIFFHHYLLIVVSFDIFRY